MNDKNLEEFIERMGLLMEREGLTRIAGRIFGLTLVTPSPCSLDEIAETLNVSKASVSNDARLLERIGMIEQVGRPGDRRTYYQITRDSFLRSLATRVERMTTFASALADAAALPDIDGEVRQRLAVHQSAYREVITALERAMKNLDNSMTDGSAGA